MIFTGTNLSAFRSFYTQNNNFEVNIDFSVNNPLERYEFGVTGTSKLGLILESGKIIYDGLFLHSYLPNQEYNLKIELTDNKINVIKDDVELVYGGIKNTGNFYNFFATRSNTGINAVFDFGVSGKNLPIYSVDKIGYFFNTGQNTVTGKITNVSGFDIRVFESTSYASQNLSFSGASGTISSGNNLAFYYTGDISSFDYSQPIFTTFNTNFGDVGINFKIIDLTAYSKFVLFENISNLSFDSNNEINRTLFYTNYSGETANANYPTDLFFKLDYLSGSGSFNVGDFAQSAHFSSIAYGNFLESGTVTGRKDIATGNSSVTGIYTITFDRFQWATGKASGYFTGLGIGTSSGVGYTGRAYGFFSGYATGKIYDGSGSLQLNNYQVVGYSSGESYSIDYPSFTNATGYINLTGLRNGDYIYIGEESTPIMRGLQYTNLTGFVYYLNNNSGHLVKAISSGGIAYLESRVSGSLGNNIFIKNAVCDMGDSIDFTPYLLGGADIGTTGNVVYGVQPFTGYIDTKIYGSGDFSQAVTDNKAGSFSFTRTFTGSWDLLTGLTTDTLVKVKESSEVISGRGIFSPNSSMIFQVNHYDSEFNQDGAILTISGSGVVNPIIQILSQ